jgi:hypothetical protein
MSGGAGLGGVRSRVAGSVRRRGVGRRGVRSCGVSQVAWGQVGGAGSIRQVGQTRARLVNWACGGRLDCWLQVMDVWSITLGDE